VSGPSLARFIEPMLLTPARMLPEGPSWSYELKLDGFRALSVKSAGAENRINRRRFPETCEKMETTGPTRR
jgi:ATP-dependent DNA ligase